MSVLLSAFRFSDERRAVAPDKLVSVDQHRRAGFKIALCMGNVKFSA